MGRVRRVLVADDDAASRLLCRVNLEADGVEVIEAADGVEALILAQRRKPDAVILDVMMPGTHGFDIAKALLEDPQMEGVPIIFLSARAEVSDQMRGIEIGAMEYITKPFNPLELSHLIDLLVERVERGEGASMRAERLAELRSHLEK